jgi:hypothetical protein
MELKEVTAEDPEGESTPPPVIPSGTFYTVTVAGGMTGGTLSASPKSGEAGAEITLTAAADSGYRLKAGTLKYNNGIGDTPVDESTKKFYLPSYNVTVSAQFETLPGLVHSAEDFAKIGTPGYPLDGDYELTANITLPSGWMPIGSGTAPFTGTFDGRGRSITISSFPSAGIDISAASGMDALSDLWTEHFGGAADGIAARGLFAYTENAVIKDLDITVNASFTITPTAAQQVQFFGTVAAYAVNTAFTDINISGGVLNVNASSVHVLWLGGIAGLLMEGTSIRGCTVDVKIQTVLGNTASSVIGGVVAWIAESSDITNCSMTGDVEVSGGDTSIGGLVGAAEGSVTNSSVSGNVSAVSAYGDSEAGGIAGRNGGIIENCYSTGNVSAEYTGASIASIKAGGLVAQLEGSDDGSSYAVIGKSYSTGTINAVSSSNSGRVRAGGIAAHTWASIEITDCYSTGDVSAAGVGGEEVQAGGITGISSFENNAVATIARCYATGDISVFGSYLNKFVGSIAGLGNVLVSGNSGSITGCAALSGAVSYSGSGSGSVSRVAMVYSNYSLINNIANTDMLVNGAKVSAGDADTHNGINGLSKTSTELENQATYTALGWDFSTVWKMEGGRPVLQ